MVMAMRQAEAAWEAGGDHWLEERGAAALGEGRQEGLAEEASSQLAPSNEG